MYTSDWQGAQSGQYWLISREKTPRVQFLSQRWGIRFMTWLDAGSAVVLARFKNDTFPSTSCIQSQLRHNNPRCCGSTKRDVTELVRGNPIIFLLQQRTIWFCHTTAGASEWKTCIRAPKHVRIGIVEDYFAQVQTESIPLEKMGESRMGVFGHSNSASIIISLLTPDTTKK